MTTLVLTGTLYPGTSTEPYAYLPFDVPEGTTRLELHFRHAEGNIIDLGVLDPHFRTDVYPETIGFRGWSGGARDSFFITQAEATPGYLAGELLPGTWQVMLGLYRVKEGGCSYRMEIRLESAPQPERAPTPVQAKPEKGAGWYAADLHSHTHYSDARGSLENLLRVAEGRGLEILAVTDHNTVSHHAALATAETPLLLVPGQEVTTSRGHANVWGDIGWADFRLRGAEDVSRLVAQVKARGGLFSINHPKNTGYNWVFALPERFDCLEVWQMAWVTRNWESVALADALLKAGRRFTFVGGSDRHQPGFPDTDPLCKQVGTPTTWLHLDAFTLDAALDALRNGKTCVSEGPQGPRLELRVGGAAQGGVVSRKSPHPITATVIGAKGDMLRYVADGIVVREVEISGDGFIDNTLTSNSFTDTWFWQPEGHSLRAEIIAERKSGEKMTRLELAAFGLTLTDQELNALLALPRLRALTSPVFVAG